MSEKFDAVLQRIIRLLFLGLFFCLPLIFWIPNSEVFELPKIYFVYATTALIAGLWTARMIVRREILIRRTPLDIPILLFLLSQITSTIYSIDPHVSWFGWYGRFNGGLLSTISYTVLYYAFVNNKIMSNEKKVMSNEEKKNKSALFSTHYFLLIILSSASFVSLYALLQHFGIDRDFWVQDVMNRVFSTQGQPNWLAGYIVMTMQLVFVITSSKFKIQSSKFFSYGIITVLFLALLWTKSRSGLVGMAAVDVIFWGLVLIRIKGFKIQDSRFKKTFLLIHGLILVLILITNNPLKDFLLNPSRFSLTYQRINASTIPRKSELGGTESGDIRKLVWLGALNIAKQNPIFGTGPETFGLTYWQVRPKEANLTSEWNFLYNKAHNEWLNLTANTGLVGLGTHLLLIAWFTIWALKGPALPLWQGRALFNYAILAGLLGVEIVNFFGFSTVTTETYRYLFMGMAVAMGQKEERIRKKEEGKKISLLTAYCFLFTVCLATLYSIVQISNIFRADLNYNRGRQFYSAGVVGEAINPLYRAVELAPNEPVFRNELAETLSAAAVSIWSDGDKDQAIKVKNEAVANFRTVSNQSKFNITFMRTKAQMEFIMREIDPSLTEESLELAKKTIDLSHTDPRGYYLLGRMYEELGKTTEAHDLYRRAIELKPDYGEEKIKFED